MFKFNITSKETNHGELSAWFVSRDADYEFRYITDVNDWMNGKSHQIYDITIYDEHVAMEFRLSFGANIGESRRPRATDVEAEIMAVLLADITKDIDEQIVKEILSLYANE
jgi:hypothetical protein